MLAASTFSTQSSPPHNFLPAIPSPLSPRRANGRTGIPQSRNFPDAMSSSQQSPTQSHMPYASRQIKPVPVAQRSDALRERRRDMFLRKVRQGREDFKWDSRIDDMARLDYVNQKKRWEAEQARSAPPPSSDLAEVEDENELPESGNQMSYTHEPVTPQSDQEADAILQQENAELEALVSLMNASEGDDRNPSRSNRPSDEASTFGSDDEDYDSLFMDLIDETGGVAPSHDLHQEVGDEMDLT